MKKVFISMPMNGKSEEEVRAQFEKNANHVMTKYPNVEIIDSICNEDFSNPLQYLAFSIECLAKADAAWFAPCWDKYRGCQIERVCCEQYGVEILNG